MKLCSAGLEKLHVWDLSMVLNLIEAGGVATRKDGSEIDFTKPGEIGDLICSSNSELHRQVLEIVNRPAASYS